MNSEDIFLHPEILTGLWVDQALPISFYSNESIRRQRQINDQTLKVVTYSKADKSQWTEIDFEPITPYTWKWVDLEMTSNSGEKTVINLRRPNWWLTRNGATSVGNEMYLDIPEMGVVGKATVTNIRPNQLDTRLWEGNTNKSNGEQPITGKFDHESNEVYLLTFDSGLDSIFVTGNHPFWSLDKNDWVKLMIYYLVKK